MIQKPPIFIAVTLFLISSSLYAFEGRIFSVAGKNTVIVGEGVAHLKPGQKLGVYSGDVKTGEIVIQQALHTQARARISSGTAAKDSIVRVIAAEKKVGSGSFRDSGDGTVKDASTKLIWQKCSIGQNNDDACSGKAQAINWEDAKTACNNLQLAGKKWRLPEKEELKSLIYCSDGTKTEEIKDLYLSDWKKNNENPNSCGWSGGDNYEKKYDSPTIRSVVFPNTVANPYWSESTYVTSESVGWVVYFSGGIVSYNLKTYTNFVRCVSGP